MLSQHGEEPPICLPVGVTPPREYRVDFLLCHRKVDCPVEGCGYQPTSRSLLKRHFQARHPLDTVVIPQETGTMPCRECGMPLTLYAQRRHQSSRLCKEQARRRTQRERLLTLCQAQERRFFAGGDELGMVNQFRYLGRALSEGDSDAPALYQNIRKARQKWARFSKLCRAENLSPATAGRFYMAVVMAVLLYGAETWVWSDRMVKTVRGFHHRVVRRLASRLPHRLPSGAWEYPPIDEAFQITGVKEIEHYIGVRFRTARAHLVTRPIWHLCRESRRLPGTPTNHTWWWEQALAS